MRVVEASMGKMPGIYKPHISVVVSITSNLAIRWLRAHCTLVREGVGQKSLILVMASQRKTTVAGRGMKGSQLSQAAEIWLAEGHE